MKRFMFGAFVAFWAAIASLWTYATLAEGAPGASAPAGADAQRSVSPAELAAHGTPDACWMAIDGIVYDFTTYIPQHPAPPMIMHQWCGREASEAYHTKGYGRPHSPAADTLLPPYRIGPLITEADTSAAE